MRRALIALALTASMLTSQPTLVDSVWSFLSAIWSQSSPDAGCGADPNGRCAPQPRIDAGCGADPDGCPEGS
ncbi:MAG TPA: hypothetical protein VN493_03580 [Thermoanaerobaculia bacterium]|nr:hypothetical protein [Thermoanaerobaculia bacterium]